MLQANELRIGNLAFMVGGELSGLSKVTGILSETHLNSQRLADGKDFEKIVIPFYEPIPLNEEWLLKFGFEKKDCRFWQSGYFVLHQDLDGNLVYKSRSLEIDVKHVHQLQNLYFALTGEELKLVQ